MTDAPVVQFLDSHSCQRRCYLGDGVYAGHDGFQVWLVVEREDTVHNIALDESVQAALIRYLRPTIGLRREQEDSD